MRNFAKDEKACGRDGGGEKRQGDGRRRKR